MLDFSIRPGAFVQVFVWPKRSHVELAALRKDGGTRSMRTSQDSQGLTSGLQTLGCERSDRSMLLRKRARLHHSSDTLSLSPARRVTPPNLVSFCKKLLW